MDNSLTLITNASKMLAEATTIQKAKELKDLALTAGDWARRKGLGEEAIQYARSYAFEAERRMGELLRDTPRAKGGQPYQENPTCSPRVQVEPTLPELGITRKESSRAQLLADLPKETFEAIQAGDLTVGRAVREIRQQKPHIANNSGENEWYTPEKFIKAAREVMDIIHVDPASSEIANQIVQAETYYTIEENGLIQKWHGNIWMNPPYSQPQISHFTELLSDKYECGEIAQACVLVNNATETKWFQRMLESSCAVCFLAGRVKFIDRQGKASGTPLQGQAILYFGRNIRKFCEVFFHFGKVLVCPNEA